MPSRTSDPLFSMARYIERADNGAAGAVASKAHARGARVKARSAGRRQNTAVFEAGVRRC